MLLKISQYASMFTPLPSLQEQSLAFPPEGSHGVSFPPYGTTVCTGQGKDQRGTHFGLEGHKQDLSWKTNVELQLL